MARRRVAVHHDGFPKLLLEILTGVFNAAPDIDIVNSGAADVAIVSDAISVDNRRKITAPLVIEIASNGRTIGVAVAGQQPKHLGDYSGDILLALVRRAPPELAPHGFWNRLFSASASTKQQPGPPARLISNDRAVDSYFAALASRITKSAGPVPDAGPRRDLLHLAEAVVARGGGAEADLPPGLAQLKAAFGLTAADCDILFLASLVEVDPSAARMVGLLNDHLMRTRPSIGILTALGHSPQPVAANFATGPMRSFALATLDGEEPVIARPVRAHPDVWPLVLGLERAPPFRHGEPEDDTTLALSDDQRQEMGRVADAVARLALDQVLVVIAGDTGVGRTAIAAWLARRFCTTSLVVSADRLGDDAALDTLVRESVLNRAAVVITGANELDLALWLRATRRLTMPIFATAPPAGVGALTLNADRPVIELSAPRRDIDQRRRMWHAVAPDWPDNGLSDLSERFDFGRTHMRSAVNLARSSAQANGRATATTNDLRAACETLRDTRFDGLAERLDCPFAPDDIVLGQATRAELDLTIAWARHGARIFGVGGAAAQLHSGSGLACLFSGPPGVGKTMAAQIIASQVDYALYRIDLSQVVDKFIGESEKRLSALFDEAERSRVALFFDEADALFGKRTEVRDSHDRYANITVDHLLQRIDDFGGLAILATNLAGNLDDAFLRRIRVRAEFQAPDAPDRRRIWAKLLGNDCACDIDIARLADAFELVGGEIRNAVYTAYLYAADAGRPVAMEDCVRGLWRELKKIGRVVDPAHLGPWGDMVAAHRTR